MKWYGCHKEVSESVISGIASEIGVDFPQDYLEFIKTKHGGSPEYEVIDLPNRKECVFDRLLSFDTDKGNFKRTYINLVERLPKGVVPIATDPFGNYYCFKFLGSNISIVLWNHETESEEDVADSFMDMINMLYIPS